MKKKLLIIAGSGATRDFGMPSVQEVHESFLSASQKMYPLYSETTENLYGFLFDEVDKYWKNQKPDSYNKKANFEDILYIAYLLTSYNPYINADNIPDILHLGQKRRVDRDLLQNFGQFLVDHLLEDMRTRCKKLQDKDLRPLEKLLDSLSKQFEVSVLTTNYDNVFYRALGELETGFNNSGKFDAARLINRNNWPCILHLHGSVHFDMRSDTHNLHTVFWHKDLDQNFQQNAAGRNLRYTNEGITFPTSSIIAGYGKTAQILTLPFRTYYAEMDRLIFESDAALFMGYGFADNHINEAFSDYRDSRNRKVAIIDYACRNTTTAGSGFDTDHAPISKAMNIFTTDIRDMECLGRKTPQTVEELKNKAEFEVSTNYSRPLSVWYGGVLDACSNADKVLKQLI